MKNKIFLFIVLTIISIVLILMTIIIGFEKIRLEQSENVSTTYYDNSRSSIVMDIRTSRVLYQNNINERMLPASTTKILTCILSIELYNLDDFVIVTNEMINTEGSKIYLEVGDIISIKDLLYGLMLCSGNDAAMTLAYHLSGDPKDFILKMNELAKKIGMKNSTFENPHGLDTTSKNYTTTYDMALLMGYAMKNETFRTITNAASYNPLIISNRRLYFHNKHKLIINDEMVTGGKTGYTKLAKRTLVTTFKKENFEIVVVTFNCSDDWKVHKSLANYAFEKYHLDKITSKFELLLKVKGNFLISSDDLFFPTIKGEEVKTKIFIESEKLKVVYFINQKESGFVTFRGIKDE